MLSADDMEMFPVCLRCDGASSSASPSAGGCNAVVAAAATSSASALLATNWAPPFGSGDGGEQTTRPSHNGKQKGKVSEEQTQRDGLAQRSATLHDTAALALLPLPPPLWRRGQLGFVADTDAANEGANSGDGNNSESSFNGGGGGSVAASTTSM